MSCKSALYTATQTPTAIPVDGILPLGSIIRRYGCDANLNGNAVNITNAGYYDVDVSVTVAPTAAGTVTVTLCSPSVSSERYSTLTRTSPRSSPSAACFSRTRSCPVASKIREAVGQ